MGPVVR